MASLLSSLFKATRVKSNFVLSYLQLRSLHPLPIGGSGSTYDTKIKRKRVVKDPNTPVKDEKGEFVVNKTGLEWTDFRMLKDVKKRHTVSELYPLRTCLSNLYRTRTLPAVIKEDARDEILALPPNNRWCRLVNRCVITSRPRGKLRRWRMSRMTWRLLADYNKLSGIQKSCFGP